MTTDTDTDNPGQGAVSRRLDGVGRDGDADAGAQAADEERHRRREQRGAEHVQVDQPDRQAGEQLHVADERPGASVTPSRTSAVRPEAPGRARAAQPDQHDDEDGDERPDGRGVHLRHEPRVDGEPVAHLVVAGVRPGAGHDDPEREHDGGQRHEHADERAGRCGRPADGRPVALARPDARATSRTRRGPSR